MTEHDNQELLYDVARSVESGNMEAANAMLREAMLEAWLEAWFRKSSESKESDRSDFHEQVAKRDFERWWNRNYE